jgi:hypothetical protein
VGWYALRKKVSRSLRVSFGIDLFRNQPKYAQRLEIVSERRRCTPTEREHME